MIVQANVLSWLQFDHLIILNVYVTSSTVHRCAGIQIYDGHDEIYTPIGTLLTTGSKGISKNDRSKTLPSYSDMLAYNQ